MLAKAKCLLTPMLMLLLTVHLFAAVPVVADQCRVVRELDPNHISPIKTEVRNATGQWSCALANFVLAVKVDDASQPQGVYSLGYIEMDKLTDVQQNCGDDIDFRLELKFECGHLNFHFQHDAGRYFVSAIDGGIKMQGGPSEMRQFQVNSGKRMFIASERRHFVYKNIIELPELRVDTDIYQLTLLFWNTELEVFRPNSSGYGADFIWPPDDKSQPIETERRKLVAKWMSG